MLLTERNPSVNWEPIPLDATGRKIVWVWFRPAANPQGLIIVVPEQLLVDSAIAPGLSVRQLVMASGIDASQILCWTLNGMSFDAAGGQSPLLDQMLPPSTAGGNLEIAVWMGVPQMPAWPGMPQAAAGLQAGPSVSPGYAGGGGASDVETQFLAAIDSSWNGVMALEARVGSLRKELGSAVSRLNSLNRDLNSDERRTCDSKDVQDWSDARRWLRDSLSVLARCIKEIDVGITSNAGQRLRFEEMHRKYAVPRIPFPGLQQAVNEFESYRKSLQNVVASAQATILKAGRDAEQRANSVLQRVNAKMRASRRK